MAANKVIFDGETLIDLTGDTVTEETLLSGVTAHKADGSVITGTLFKGYPDEITLYGPLYDADGNQILDASGSPILAATTYRKV
ncbi:MAG: histidine kinase [Lachnospiraceae bacterium]|nr:histidine kinase [Lachnospiraceae bacterium]